MKNDSYGRQVSKTIEDNGTATYTVTISDGLTSSFSINVPANTPQRDVYDTIDAMMPSVDIIDDGSSPES